MTDTPSNNKITASNQNPAFNFQRMGGIDQATLKTDDEWRNLARLDQKLWMALSCPIAGLEFSQETLALIDTDKDGRIRYCEVLDAVDWVCQRLEHPSRLCDGGSALELDNIRKDTAEGKALAQAARLALDKTGKNGENSITLDEAEAVLAEAAGYPFNGDGIVPADSAGPANPDMERYIKLGLAIVGGKKDASGKPGLDAALAAELQKRLRTAKDWRAAMKQAHLLLGEKTGDAWTMLTRLGAKIDDFFYRSKLAEFAPDTLEKLNEAVFTESSEWENNDPELAGGINREVLEKMPLARIEGGKTLNFGGATNPVWEDDLAAFQSMFAPLIKNFGGNGESLDEKTWKQIKEKFSPYAAILGNKPSYAVPAADAERLELEGMPPLALASAGDPLERNYLPLDADAALEALDDTEIDKLLEPQTADAFSSLVEKDLAAPALASIQDLRKALLYRANLYTFLMNFLSFLDFYNPDKKAIFQSGTLYLDSRACALCVPVDDLETHSRLSAQSHLCLVYCACSRREADGAERTANIAAALTAGTEGELIEGRHGVFVDNAGKEWDTRITRIIHNPVSLSEAVWAPYIRAAHMAGEQLHKFVGGKEEAMSKMAGQAATSVMPGAKPAAGEKGGFDFAKGAGIFAAVSVAISVLSAAFAYIAHSLVSLGWWWPLAIVAIFLCISGPSVIIAWFNLRRRNLGPLLDASGWAVNEGAPINNVMGNALTSLGKLPPNALRDTDDPYTLAARLKAQKRKRHFYWWCFFIIALAVAACACWLYWMGEPAWLLKWRIALGL